MDMNISREEAASRLDPILSPLIDCVTAAFSNARRVACGHSGSTCAVCVTGQVCAGTSRRYCDTAPTCP